MTSTAGPAFRIQQAGLQQQLSMQQEWFSTCEWKKDFNCLVCHDALLLWNFRRSSGVWKCQRALSRSKAALQQQASSLSIRSPGKQVTNGSMDEGESKSNDAALNFWCNTSHHHAGPVSPTWTLCVWSSGAPGNKPSRRVGSHTEGHLHVTWVNSGRTMAPDTDYMLQGGGMLPTCWCTSAELILNN